MVGQVQVVGILMIVQGALASLMGLLLAVVGPAMFALTAADRKAGRMSHEDEIMLTIMPIIYLVIGLVVLIAGVLNLIAGIRLQKFRGRTFALVALFANILPLMTCYCAPTSIGMMVYGLIVLFNSEVARAFQLATEGMSPADIRAQFRPGGDSYGRAARPDWKDS